ncbi:hypothetical protein DSO57_1008952 [Entomophthora muscae]|uniref:Uncharacterized protein n=1 Tax=Entomophthora muscae TaxID=34485 RepID=A0ACC2U581_9FUNG|nr:hypothetical protein DSO57_1008952 [Entomophthora muscae]
MHSSIYRYYILREDYIECFMCQYSYHTSAPLSTLQKHMRVKHGYSIRCPPPRDVFEKAIHRAKLYNIYRQANQFKFQSSNKPPPSRRITINELLN